MQVKQKIIISKLNNKLLDILNNFRIKRNFNLEKYIDNKSNFINLYFKENNLDTAIVAVSGGIDSAVALSLIYKTSQIKNSSIKNIIPIFIPCNSESATNQDTAYLKALSLCEKFNLSLKNIDLTHLHNNVSNSVQNDFNYQSDKWANGQLVSYLRTSTLYYCTSLLTANNLRPVIIGTTNLDEGAYTGYFGKASDGMVDIQIISDIHKNEVFKIAKHFNLPENIIKATPTGDMYDGRKDEEVFGAPYDFVELYYHLKQLKKSDFKSLIKTLNKEEKKEFKIMFSNIDNMNRYNKHKYYGASPAVHLDVIKTKIKNGWCYKNYTKKIKNIEYGDHKSW